MKAKRLFAIWVVAALGAVLAGCGDTAWTGEDAEVTTIGVDADGHVLEIVVEDFQESYYSVEGLRATMESDIAAYNADVAAAEDETPPIVLNDVRKDGGKIRTSTTYQTAEDYSDYTYETLYFGTLRQARLYGYELSQTLKDAEGAVYELSGEDDDNHVVFSEGHDRLVTPYRILAATQGVRIVSDTEADFADAEGRAAVLLAK